MEGRHCSILVLIAMLGHGGGALMLSCCGTSVAQILPRLLVTPAVDRQAMQLGGQGQPDARLTTPLLSGPLVSRPSLKAKPGLHSRLSEYAISRISSIFFLLALKPLNPHSYQRVGF